MIHHAVAIPEMGNGNGGAADIEKDIGRIIEVQKKIFIRFGLVAQDFDFDQSVGRARGNRDCAIRIPVIDTRKCRAIAGMEVH